MENNTKEIFLGIIPRIQTMIQKQERHIDEMNFKKESFLNKQLKQNKKLIFKLFPYLKINYSEIIGFLDQSIKNAESSKTYFEKRLKEYQEYILKKM